MEDLILQEELEQQDSEEEEYTVNRQARKVIRMIEQKTAACKKEAIQDLLLFLNKICKEKGLQYAAVGALLTFCLEKKDAYEEELCYELRMRREDYDVLKEEVKKTCNAEKISMERMEREQGMVCGGNFAISKRVQEKKHNIYVTVMMAIMPLDRLSEEMQMEEELFPAKTVPFLETELMIPAVPEKFSIMPEPAYSAHVRGVRYRALEKFDAFCKKYDLTYFAFGSLAVECVNGDASEPVAKEWRVGLLREDYERAVTLLREQGEKDGLVLKEVSNRHSDLPCEFKGFVSIEDNKIDVLGHTYQVLMEPFDNVPKDFAESMKFKKRMRKMIRRGKKIKGENQGVMTAKGIKELVTYYAEKERLAQTYRDVTNAKEVVRFYGEGTTLIPIHSLLPVQRMKIGDVEINMPANKYQWYKENDAGFTEALIEEKKKLLKVVDEICCEKGIPYFAIGKLLIGTVVYHDMIPNGGKYALDLGLVREEYEKLVRLLRERGSEYGISLKEYYDEKKKFPYKTKAIAFKGQEDSRVEIRIIPFDKMPESYYTRRAYKVRMRMLNKKFDETFLYQTSRRPADAKNDTKLQTLFKKIRYGAINLNRLARKIEKMAQAYNDDPQAFSYARVAFSFSKTIDVDDLYPLQRQQFRDIEITCPKDYSVWQPIQDDALKYQVACIQEADKRLILELDRVCREIGVGYFVCGGTMLGYMRHEGFIPWDDDVDVAMLRADYDKFLAEADKYLGDEFFLQTRKSDPNIPYLFSKLRLNGTEYITEYNKDRDFHKGLCLDIFPFDYVPNDEQERAAFVEKVIRVSKEHGHIANNQTPEVPEPFAPRNRKEERYKRQEKKKIAKFWETSLEKTQKKYIDLATSYNDRAEELGLTTVASFVPSYTYIQLSDLLPYQRGTFENIEVSVPKRPDIFLTMQYGDFMQLPPVHQRVAHRLIRWSDGKVGQDNEKKRDYSNIGGNE